MIAALVIVGLVALQRLVELVYAQRNTRALLARGAVEIGRAHYPLFVLLHASWLVAILAMLAPSPSIHWPALAVVIALQALRLWVIATLGPYWTTRIVTLPDAPLVRSGPYRFLRHPNYAVVIGEIAALPLVFGQLYIAILFSLLNGLLLWWRIRVEDQALEARRGRLGG
jgi:methyltransferase